jgi:hypothetical protein
MDSTGVDVKKAAAKFIESATRILRGGGSVEMLLTNVIKESVQQNEDVFPERGRYIFLWHHLYAIGVTANAAFRESSGESKKVTQLQRSMDRLDDECGTDICLSPSMSDHELDEKLALVDADKVKFAAILKEELGKNAGAFRTFLIEYARLVYQFNGYQAEARTDVAMAMLDSMGVSDHFQELLDTLMADKKA